ncbi:MAG TPA: type III-B CRISPR module RAMP protein Cmr6 [Gemmataceae bacterium]|nr:type III-B CRISPR module RAMP protein Cmr6 [Gemmataceae bacterium]
MRKSITALANRDQPADRPEDRGGRFRGQHAGLLLQRFAVHSADGSEQWSKEKRTILKAAIAAAGDPELRRLYEAAFKRWEESLPSASEAAELRTAGRLIVGLGSENILETGIRLHHTYGLPVIPGSALKGLAAHYCHRVWGQSSGGDAVPVENKRFRRPTKDEDEAYRKFLRNEGPKPEDSYFRLLFGTTDDSGCITFHDAWLTPDSPNPLALDVMTPHHPDWADGTKAPTDFDSPTPVPFVSVDGKFRVAVSWTGPECDEAKNWTNFVFARLREALREWGVGGKTSSGYGRLVEANAPRPVLAPMAAPPRPQSAPQPGNRVEAVLLEERTKKGGWKAKHESSGLDGPIQNTGDVPGDKKPGDKVTLIVASATQREIAFRYPTAADEQRAQKPQGKSKGGPGGKPPPRGGRR